MADNNVWVNITDLLWPVGSAYFCYTSTNTAPVDNVPANLFGGTWVGPVDSGTTVINNITYYQWKYYRTATGIEA